MKTALPVSLMTFLLLATSNQCFAEMMLADVSKDQAKEWGVTLRARKNGTAGVAVTLEFKTQGVLKKFTRVELDVSAEGKHLLTAPLRTTQPTADSVSAHFSADPLILASSTLMIVVSEPALGGSGYRFKVKDFVELEKYQ